MTAIKRSALVRHSPRQMFDLVNDVDSYEKFLPWCESSTVRRESAEEMLAEISLGRGAIKCRFTTLNTLNPPGSIAMKLVKGPFRSLSGLWTFKPLANGACQVECTLQFEFSNPVHKMVLKPLLTKVSKDIVAQFCKRADRIHGVSR